MMVTEGGESQTERKEARESRGEPWIKRRRDTARTEVEWNGGRMRRCIRCFRRRNVGSTCRAYRCTPSWLWIGGRDSPRAREILSPTTALQNAIVSVRFRICRYTNERIFQRISRHRGVKKDENASICIVARVYGNLRMPHESLSYHVYTSRFSTQIY